MIQEYSEDAATLPPFRSSKSFPRSPGTDKVTLLYPECFQALREANEARMILRLRMERKRKIIIQIRNEIERLEQDLALEADTRVRLYAMKEMLVDALRDMQQTSDDFTSIVDEAQHSRTGLMALIEQLKAVTRRWRTVKIRQADKLAHAALFRHDGGSDD